MAERFSVDHLDGDFAVCEDAQGKLWRVAVCVLPEGTREGDILQKTDDDRWIAQPEETRKARKKALELQHTLFPRD